MSAEYNRLTVQLMDATLTTQQCAQHVADHQRTCPICLQVPRRMAMREGRCPRLDALLADYRATAASRDRISRQLCELEDRP